MTAREQEFLHRLRATFRQEAAEHLQTMAAELLALEKTPPPQRNRAQLESIFRTAHSLKGASRAVNAKEVEAVCQALENVFAGWKQGTVAPAAGSFDLLHQAVELISVLVQRPGDRPAADVSTALTDLLVALEVRGIGPVAAPPASAPPAPNAVLPAIPPPPPPPPENRSAGTVRLSVEKLDQLLQTAEELLSVKQAAAQRTAELRQLRAKFAEWEFQLRRLQPARRSLQHALPPPGPGGEGGRDGGTLGAARELCEFLDWASAHLRSLDSLLHTAQRDARREGHAATKMVDAVLAETKQLLMLPVGTVIDSLPLLARQLGRERGKEIEVVVRGSEVEMDKRILEALKDPLIHLVRNAVDHGVESAEERRRQGKPGVATLIIAVAAVDGGKVEIAFADDGAGIDGERVRAAAVQKGVLTPAEAQHLDPQQAIALIFQSDVTTSPIVTDISGRGLGLAIVREKTEKLGGRVVVETHRGRGTTFRLQLPITLSAFRGLLVRVRDRIFILPATSVERVARVRAAEVRTVENRETITLGGRALSLARLAAVLELPEDRAAAPPPPQLSVVVLGACDDRVAFAVDEVIHDEEVRVKPLAPPLRRVRNVAGACLLASGLLVPVLNPADLLKSARQAALVPREAAGAAEIAGTAPVAKSVLVAEDSITSRTLLKGILEAAGYRVRTVVDGVEALEALRSATFDLVVSDVQMPRMSGFDLTARIRAERRLAEIPVVLVTALAAPADRERGIEVGANAYLVKSDFDQSNLLDLIRRLA